MVVEGGWLRPSGRAAPSDDCAPALSRKVHRAVAVCARAEPEACALAATGSFTEDEVVRCARSRGAVTPTREPWRGREVLRLRSTTREGRARAEVVFLRPSVVIVGSREAVDPMLDAALASSGRAELPSAVRDEWRALPAGAPVRGVIRLDPRGMLPGATAVRLWGDRGPTTSMHAALRCEGETAARELSRAIEPLARGASSLVAGARGFEVAHRVEGATVFVDLSRARPGDDRAQAPSRAP